MTELICNQGHVIDPGRALCSRCNGAPIGTAEGVPITAAPALAENEEVKARSEEEVKETALDVESLTKKEIEAELIKLGVEFKVSESKADLLEKLKESAEASAEDVEDADEDESEDEDDL